jgi:predicted RNase H-like HicB family nuclease
MTTAQRRPLNDYLALQYPFNVLADPDGGYVIVFPDLPGCMTQAETIDEIPQVAEEARRLWIETAYEDGEEIPLPSYPEEYSGKFVLRLPRSLHRRLAEVAAREGVSLNQYVVSLLSRAQAEDEVLRALARLEARLSTTIPAPVRPRYGWPEVSKERITRAHLRLVRGKAVAV